MVENQCVAIEETSLRMESLAKQLYADRKEKQQLRSLVDKLTADATNATSAWKVSLTTTLSFTSLLLRHVFNQDACLCSINRFRVPL